MNPHSLSSPLDHLQAELARVPAPAATDPLLAEVRQTTAALLAQTAASPTLAPHPSFRQQLGLAVDRFGATHPTLAAAIGQVADTLNRMGL